MRLIASSKEDKASENILSHLLEYDWDEIEEWRGNPVYKRGGDYIASLNQHHIYVDNIDKELEELLSVEFDQVVYISKHSSEAGIHSLTVHPVGNYGEAKYGGLGGRLVSTSPRRMTRALRILNQKAEESGLEEEYEVSFEATHHGPYLETPTYYIEIGSDEGCWMDERAGEVLAETVMDVKKSEGWKSKGEEEDAAICVGGGHYAPRYTDLALTRKISIGHMVPGWAMKYLTLESFEEAVEKTPGAEYVYFDRGSTSGKERERVGGWAEDHGLEVVRSADLELLE